MATTAEPAQLEAVLGDSAVVARYWEKIWVVPGTTCLWWTGAVSGRGHGRFWLTATTPGQGRVMIAHRFAYALAHGVDALAEATMLGHECDNPLCQNVEHIEPSTAALNAHDWAVRRHRRRGPLQDRRGSLERALAVRAAILEGRDVTAILEAGDPHREQLLLWGDSAESVTP